MAEAQTPGGEYKYFIFGGFCLIASFFSNRFLQSVSDKVIQDFRTLEGISSQLGIAEDIAIDVLEDLESNQLVKSFENTDGNRIFSITKQGRRVVCMI